MSLSLKGSAPLNTASLPLYLQIKNAILEKVRSGEWQPGQKIPSENQLAEDLGASRMTINRPLRELTAEGVLKRVHGLGTFVAEPPRRASLIELKPIEVEIAEQGKSHRHEVQSLVEIKAKQALAERMNLLAGDTLFHIVVVHFQDGVPIQIESRHVNPAIVPLFIRVDFTDITPSQYLIDQVRPDRLEHVVQAIMPDEYMARRLSIPVTEPCLRLNRRTWKGDDIVTDVSLVYPSSRYDLGAQFDG
ncbi:MAG: histidine utilization repressor [Pseudomonadota bacterium]